MEYTGLEIDTGRVFNKTNLKLQKQIIKPKYLNPKNHFHCQTR